MRDAAVKARRGGSHRGTGVRWWQAVSAVVPITLVASAWGIAIAATPASDTIDAKVGDQQSDHGAPTVTDVPTDAFAQPTFGKVKKHQSSLSPLAGFAKKQATTRALKSSPLPSAAIDAYRDAAKVMADVKASCKLDWTLVAAIGRVESDHGQYGGSTIDTTGDSSPKIIGIPLNGSNNTAAIRDTDDGQLDGDTTWDRAVGPMQFIPSTWDLVGVDGNGDGVKSPHNIYDAALATSVYLCASEEDLSTESGASEAVFSYNHSNDYVATVLAIAERYEDGDFTELPSVYLPETPESDNELFDPDSYDPGPDGNSDGGANGQNGKGQLGPTTFGPAETGNGGPQQIQPIESGATDHAGGGMPNEVDAAQPDKDDLIKPQQIGSGPHSGKPADADGTNKPEQIDGFVDDNRPKSDKPKNDDKLESGLDDGKPSGPGVDIRPNQDGPKTDGSTGSSPKRPKNDQTDVRPKNDQTDVRPKNDVRPQDDNVRPKNTQPIPKHRPKSDDAVLQACSDGSEQLQAEGTKLSRKQNDALVTSCFENSSVVWSLPTDEPVLDWMAAEVSEL